MNKKYVPLADWLDKIPEPATIFESLVCAYSDIVDEITMAQAEFKKSCNENSLTQKEQVNCNDNV